MEREIIFRGKRLSNGNWVDGSLLVYADGDCFICCEDYIPDVLNKYSVDPPTVGQYTGLTDKNGKKIFEGDLLKYSGYNNEPPYLVYWGGGRWNAKSGNCMPDDITIFDSDRWEIIGNKWDNPELLEAKR